MSKKWDRLTAQGKIDFEAGYEAGLNGKPLGIISEQFDAGWLKGKEEAARLTRTAAARVEE